MITAKSIYYIINTALKEGNTFVVGLEILTLIGEKENKSPIRYTI